MVWRIYPEPTPATRAAIIALRQAGATWEECERRYRSIGRANIRKVITEARNAGILPPDRTGPKAGGAVKKGDSPLECADAIDFIDRQDGEAREWLRRWGVIYPDHPAAKAERVSIVAAARNGRMAGRLAPTSGCGSALG